MHNTLERNKYLIAVADEVSKEAKNNELNYVFVHSFEEGDENLKKYAEDAVRNFREKTHDKYGVTIKDNIFFKKTGDDVTHNSVVENNSLEHPHSKQLVFSAEFIFLNSTTSLNQSQPLPQHLAMLDSLVCRAAFGALFAKPAENFKDYYPEMKNTFSDHFSTMVGTQACIKEELTAAGHEGDRFTKRLHWQLEDTEGERYKVPFTYMMEEVKKKCDHGHSWAGALYNKEPEDFVKMEHVIDM